MPRKARIDAPGALHHVIARGIGRRKVFDDNDDQDFFIERLAKVVSDTETQCFAWALMPIPRKYRLKAKGIDVSRIAERVADVMGMAPEAVWASENSLRMCRPAVFSVTGRPVNWALVSRG